MTNEFYKTVIKPFITALVAETSQVFDLSELPVLQALLMLDPKSYSDTESKEFQTYRNNSLRIYIIIMEVKLLMNFKDVLPKVIPIDY